MTDDLFESDPIPDEDELEGDLGNVEEEDVEEEEEDE